MSSSATGEGETADLEAFRTISELEESAVTLSAAREAVVCGALGCREGEHLIHVECGEGERRVLCPNHTAEFLEGLE